MNHDFAFMRQLSLLFFCLVFSAVNGFSQDEKMRVERIRVVPENVPILNIHVDEENIKWVANANTLYMVDSKDNAVEVPISGGEMSLLQLPGGNHDIRWNKEAMSRILGSAQVTTAAYDSHQKVLWIGTNGYGLFKLKVAPELRLLEQLHIDNSKLRSDFINSIFVAKSGKVWIATEDGANSVKDNQWVHHQRYFNILRIRGRGNELWAIGDDLIWLIDAKDQWTPIPINRREIEGDIHDITVDPESRVWIASNVMTSYRQESDSYQRFGPGQYFTSQFVNFVSVDDDATIWVGTNDKGLYIIEKESTITVTTTMDKYLDCNGATPDAAFSVRAIGGKPPYQFVWANGAKGDKLSGLGPGKYQLTVTDTEGSSKTATVEIADPFIQLTTVMDRAESDVGEEDGAASVKVKGGVAPYRYEWYSGQGEASLTGVPEGEYGITVTDAAGCSAISKVLITQNLKPLTVTLEQKEFIRCNGQGSAVVAALLNGGKGPYKYVWSNGGANQEFQENLAMGKYSVTVSDAFGNSGSAAITIAQPEIMSATIRIDGPAATNMNNGVATLQITGGKAPYSFLWDNAETTTTASKLSPRRHSVTVTDASGCTTEAAVDIMENVLPLKAAIAETSSIRCAGEATAGLKVTVDGGKSPFAYQWNQTGLSGEDVKGLKAGEYIVTVTDAAKGSTVLRSTIQEPAPIVATTIAEAPALSGSNEGHAIVRAQGGTGKLAYLWDNGDQAAKTVSLNAGIHYVSVTDEAGCSTTAEVNIVENILAISVSLNQTGTLSCAGEATAGIEASIQGGKEPYTLSWNNGAKNTKTQQGLKAGAYRLSVVDAVGNTVDKEIIIKEPSPLVASTIADAATVTGKNEGQATVRAQGGTGKYTYAWGNGDKTAKVTSLSAGMHVVTVTDEAGCSTTAEVDIPENILAINVSLEQTGTISCAGEANAGIEASISGGKEPYTLSWSNGVQNTKTQQGLKAGAYRLTVVDAVGNTIDKEISIKEPSPLVASTIADAATVTGKNEGQATVKAQGGTGKYTYAWDNGDKAAKTESLNAGVHTVTVTDEAGCRTTTEVVILENILAINVSLEQTGTITCAGESNAGIEASITGGKEPYTLTWSNGIENTKAQQRLKAGAYRLTVVDAVGNTIDKEIIIKEPSPLSVDVEVKSPASANQSDGQAIANVGGGTSPYQFKWSTGESIAQAKTLAAGKHQVTVTDANSCSAVAEVNITEDILPLRVTIAETAKIKCATQSTAAVEVNVTGGKSPYAFQWSDQSSQQTRSSLKSGEYSVEVTDAANQKTTATIQIGEPQRLSGEMIDVRPATHERIADGKATARISGGETPFTFVWDNVETTARAMQLSSGSHTVTVTDANGCTLSLSLEIAQKILPELTAENLEKGEAVRMEKLQFDADSTNINASSMPTLDELYNFLYDNPTIVVEIAGHTNGLPEHEYCDMLSTARAKAVADFITGKGIESKRVIYKGYGKRQPVATNQTPEGRRRNQRVEVRIVKLSE